MSNAASVLLLQREHDRISRCLSQRIDEIISDCASRGFSKITGPAIGQMVEAGLTAMEAMFAFAASTAASVPAEQAQSFFAAFDGSLNSISESATSRGRADSEQLASKRQFLAAQLKAMMPAASGG